MDWPIFQYSFVLKVIMALLAGSKHCRCFAINSRAVVMLIEPWDMAWLYSRNPLSNTDQVFETG